MQTVKRRVMEIAVAARQKGAQGDERNTKMCARACAVRFVRENCDGRLNPFTKLLRFVPLLLVEIIPRARRFTTPRSQRAFSAIGASLSATGRPVEVRSPRNNLYPSLIASSGKNSFIRQSGHGGFYRVEEPGVVPHRMYVILHAVRPTTSRNPPLWCQSTRRPTVCGRP
jgi:hypothetical protein